MSAAEVSRNFGKAQAAAAEGPVAITHHGRERCAVLSWEDYEKLRNAPGEAHDKAADMARRKLTLVLDTITQAYVSLDADWRFTTINRVANFYFGIPREDLIGRIWTEAFPVLAGTEADRMLRRAGSAGEPVEFVWTSTLFPGRRLAVQAFPLPRPEGGVGVLFSNLAERDRQEEELSNISGRLAALEGELPGWAMVTFDMDGTITSWNLAAETLLGWSEAAAVGQSMEMIYAAPDLAAGAPWSEIAMARRSGRSETQSGHLAKDGVIVRCHDVVLPMGRKAETFLKILRRIE